MLERNELIRYAQQYYEGRPEISDALFDKLYADYRKQGGKPLGIAFGYKPIGTRSKHHCQPIGSLEKITLKNMKGKFGKDEMVQVTPKLDGGSAVAYYEQGRLQKILTRGDGFDGIDITENLIHAVPSSIPCSEKTAVRGEILLTWEDFKDVGGGSHPRNKAVALSQSIKVDQKTVRLLSFDAYDILTSAKDKNEIHNDLEEMGFNVCRQYVGPYSEIVDGIKAESLFQKGSTFFAIPEGTVPYDGLVFCSLSREKRPSDWEYYMNKSLAFKYEDKGVEVTIRDVKWSLTKTGMIKPVAHINPVQLDGACIQKVTLHNCNWMVDKGAGIGAKIALVRKGGVTPQIKKVLRRSNKFNYPKICPSCASRVAFNGSDLKCANCGG